MRKFEIKGNVFCDEGEFVASIDTVIAGNFKYCQDVLNSFFDNNDNYFNSFAQVGCDTATYGQIYAIFIDRFDNDRFLYVNLIS